MKRWLGLFAVLAIVAVVAVVISRPTPPDTYVTRHARIRPGMDEPRVVGIMHPDLRPVHLHGDDGGRDGEVRYLEWRQQVPTDDGSGDTETVLRVYFDTAGRVTRTSVDGEDRQP